MTKTEPIIGVEQSSLALIITAHCDELLHDDDIKKIEQALAPLIIDNPGASFILDFTRVKSLSSSAIGLLLKVRNTILKNKGLLKICCLGKDVTNTSNDKFIYELFKVIKLDTVFDLYSNADEALSSLGENITKN